jgi:hypothetical protein
MIILVPLLLIGFLFATLKQTLERIGMRVQVYIAAIGVGWAGYGVVGVLIPHIDPQIWHSLSAPTFGLLALVIGSLFIRTRGIPV